MEEQFNNGVREGGLWVVEKCQAGSFLQIRDSWLKMRISNETQFTENTQNESSVMSAIQKHIE
jgi:hypothetical protein